MGRIFGSFVGILLLVSVVLSLKAIPAERPTIRTFEPVNITSDQLGVLKRAVAVLDEHRSTERKLLVQLEKEAKFQQATDFIERNVDQRLKEVEQTSTRFKEFANSTDAQWAAETFFGDIKAQYERAARQVRSIRSNDYSKIRVLANNVTDHNYRAYTLAVASKKLTFDLMVESDIQGAIVSLRREGDPYTRYENPTNTPIPNLVLAKWYVRAELSNYQPQVKPHDPFTEPNHKLVFYFKP